MICITYNIQDGGTDQLEGITNTLLALSPDVVLLQESKTFQEAPRLEAFAQHCGLVHALVAPDASCGLNVILLSRYEILHSSIQGAMTHSGLNALLRSDIGEITLSGVHLDPSNETVRTRELIDTIATQHGIDQRIIMGDFNAISHHDNYDWNETSQVLNTSVPTAPASVDFDAIKRVEKAGYHDVATHMAKNDSETVPVTTDGQARFTNLRLDYVFVSESLVNRIVEYRVIDTQEVRKYSDHLPVLVELR